MSCKAGTKNTRMIQGMTKPFTTAAVLGGALVLALPAHAERSPALDRISISAGAFHAEPTFKAGVDTPYGRAETSDRTNSRVTIPRLRADILLFDSQGISFDYFRYDRSYTRNFSDSGSINGNPVSGTGSIDASIKVDVARLTYKWWIGRGNTVFGVGLGGGYYRADLSASASGSFTAGGQTYSDGVSDRYTDDAVAPVLELGLRHAFTPNFRMYAEASGMKRSGSNLHGHLYNANVGLEWFPFKHVGFVADYGVSRVKLYHNSSSSDLDVRFEGPSLFVKARF